MISKKEKRFKTDNNWPELIAWHLNYSLFSFNFSDDFQIFHCQCIKVVSLTKFHRLSKINFQLIFVRYWLFWSTNTACRHGWKVDIYPRFSHSGKDQITVFLPFILIRFGTVQYLDLSKNISELMRIRKYSKYDWRTQHSKCGANWPDATAISARI